MSRQYIRKVDGIGRVVIPKELRKIYELEEDTLMTVIDTDDGLLLKKSELCCLITLF